MQQATDLATGGLGKCELDSEKKLWLYTFSNPAATVTDAARQLGMSPATARKGLNNLVEKELLYGDENVKRNRKYRNYDLLRILN